MTVLADLTLVSDDSNGRGRFTMRFIRGTGVLDVNGDFFESLPGLPATATVYTNTNQPNVVGGGAMRGGYDAALGIMTLHNANAGASAGQHVNWLIIA